MVRPFKRSGWRRQGSLHRKKTKQKNKQARIMTPKNKQKGEVHHINPTLSQVKVSCSSFTFPTTWKVVCRHSPFSPLLALHLPSAGRICGLEFVQTQTPGVQCRRSSIKNDPPPRRCKLITIGWTSLKHGTHTNMNLGLPQISRRAYPFTLSKTDVRFSSHSKLIYNISHLKHGEWNT